jgi:cytochrome c553
MTAATLSVAVMLSGAAAQTPIAASPTSALTTPQLIAERMQPCTLCHADRGRATSQGYFPRIAGKPAGYLFNQLSNFRSGRRHFPEMVYFTQLQGDESLRQMAEYFAAQQPPYPPPERPAVSSDALARGRALAMQGDRTQQLPACASCHGERLLGVAPAVPGLLGVSQEYLLGQLGAWRNDTRSAEAPDCMAEVARRLTPSDLAAVTAWLASQPVPADTAPDASFNEPPPLRCGSISATALSTAGVSGIATAAMSPAEAQLARGRELVRVGNCEACHSEPGGRPFSGGRSIPTRFGTFFAPNITPDAASGIGLWSAEDFWRALHDGARATARCSIPRFPIPTTRGSRARTSMRCTRICAP